MRKCLFIAIILIFTIIFVACENPFWNVENKCSHQYSEWTTKIEATCVEKEIQEKICSLCDDKQTQEIGEIDLATHIFDTIPATCTTDSIPGSCTREGCDEPNLEAVVLAGHDWNNWIQGTNATVVNPVGFETRTCKRGECGYSETRAFDFYYTIGDTGPGGGRIFFVADGVGFLADNTTPKPLGFTLFMTASDTVGTTAYYLEASTVATLGGTGAQTTMRWSIRTTSPFPTVNIANDASGRSIGTGKRNTAIIIAAEEAERGGSTYIYAALACDNYSTATADDWFLPSRDELNELYKERAHFGISSGWFWSSSQNNSSSAWGQNFVNGNQYFVYKYSDFNVRAVRAF